ncbi:acyltransferase 3 [Methylobacterium sp. 4-46]|uniref:acyltransferase family protein n=1 Tax=unclassified Methylobacterium TaxID=2615210 RepID=UPI000152D61D|nr:MULTISPECIES: acyltransferase [Methylobacterium]ACA19306.1 acyltransferase 3 [Methylobacterium sp. 4-46]WFT78508.1 acyltransferase [Methylobacterium nodulans]
MISIRQDNQIPPRLSAWLDLARGIAAIEVLLFHSYQLLFLEKVPGAEYSEPIRYLYSFVWMVSQHGVAAVIVFFVLSGYLVGGPAIVRARTGRLSAADYAGARLSRLYTVLIPSLVLSALLYVLSQQSANWSTFAVAHADLYHADRLLEAKLTPAAAACNALFLQTILCHEFAGNLALWSLSNEAWYYVLFFCLLSIRQNVLCPLIAIFVLALFVASERLDVQGTHTGLKFFFYFAIWCIGAAVYAVRAPGPLIGAAIALGVAVSAVLLARGLLPSWAAYHLQLGLLTAGAIKALEILDVGVTRLGSWTGLIARSSFSLYAFHYPMLVALNVAFAARVVEYNLTSILLWATFSLICIMSSCLLYLLFERHSGKVRAVLTDMLKRRHWRKALVAPREIKPS